jgi:hypothetical protein
MLGIIVFQPVIDPAALAMELPNDAERVLLGHWHLLDGSVEEQLLLVRPVSNPV